VNSNFPPLEYEALSPPPPIFLRPYLFSFFPSGSYFFFGATYGAIPPSLFCKYCFLFTLGEARISPLSPYFRLHFSRPSVSLLTLPRKWIFDIPSLTPRNHLFLSLPHFFLNLIKVAVPRLTPYFFPPPDFCSSQLSMFVNSFRSFQAFCHPMDSPGFPSQLQRPISFC